MAKRRVRMSMNEEMVSPISSKLKGLAGYSAGFTLFIAGSWILYSHFGIDHTVALPEGLPGERKTFASRSAGQLSYYRSQPGTAGRPLVLLHSINAAASAYEMRPLFLHYSAQRPVFALDWPGFGFSERPKRVYAPGIYEQALLEFLEKEVGEPADLVALSLGCEFAARAALAQPDRIKSLALISPTGFSLKNGDSGSQKASRSGMSNLLHAAFAFPLWARAFYDLIATRTSIQYFLQKSFIGAVPPDLVEYAYANAHQPGAEHAPLYFISGKLFTPRIRQLIYERLKVPSLVLYDRDGFTSFEMLPNLMMKNPAWQAVRLVPSLGLPHFERLEDTAAVLDTFWKD